MNALLPRHRQQHRQDVEAAERSRSWTSARAVRQDGYVAMPDQRGVSVPDQAGVVAAHHRDGSDGQHVFVGRFAATA